jgi:hypothetical protein
MARGFFGRLQSALGKVSGTLGRVFGAPEPPAESPPPVSPTGGGDFFPPGGGTGGDGLTPENRIWDDRAIGNDRYNTGLQSDYRDLYENATAPLQLNDAEDRQFWDEFLRAFYLTSSESDHISRDRFYRDIGIRKRDFEMDWQEWREIKRGTP